MSKFTYEALTPVCPKCSATDSVIRIQVERVGYHVTVMRNKETGDHHTDHDTQDGNWKVIMSSLLCDQCDEELNFDDLKYKEDLG